MCFSSLSSSLELEHNAFAICVRVLTVFASQIVMALPLKIEISVGGLPVYTGC